jgi:YaiO family outer membrane protein
MPCSCFAPVPELSRDGIAIFELELCMQSNIYKQLIFKAILSCVLMCGVASMVAAQTESADELFQKARQLAFNGQRKEAAEICNALLERNPDDFDTRILLSRLHAWNGNYEVARKELQRVAVARPDYADARDALIDVELWSDNASEALRLCREGLDKEPNNETLHYKRARALNILNKKAEAIAAVEKALEINPQYKEAKQFLKQLQDSEKLYRAKVEYSYDAFDKTFDPWHMVSVSLSRTMPFGSLIGRVNSARRFGASAMQWEIDAYTRIRKGSYAYLNAGVSDSTIFPKARFGAEVYQKLPAGFDASIGFRRLHFANDNVMIYTGSVSKYYGNYLFQFHPFITPDHVGTSFSGNFLVRKYFADTDNYATLSFGAGVSPDEKYSTFDFIRLHSQKIGIDYKKSLSKEVAFTGYFGFANQSLKFGGQRKTYSFSLGIEKRF